LLGRALTGAWIETFIEIEEGFEFLVAPSRARGLKPILPWRVRPLVQVAPSRARGLKPSPARVKRLVAGRALTGAWIETMLYISIRNRLKSRPHGRVD